MHLGKIVLLAFLASSPALAGTVDSAECKRQMASVSSTLDRAGIRATARPGEASCTAYRKQFLTLVQARATVAACLTGSDRDLQVTRLDGTVEDLNGFIAQSCNGS